MIQWFPNEDILGLKRAHQIIVIPVTTDYKLPKTPVGQRLVKQSPWVVKELKLRRCCYCQNNHHPNIIVVGDYYSTRDFYFLPVMKKNPQSGIICPDLKLLKQSLWEMRIDLLRCSRTVAFDRYSFFSWKKEKEIIPSIDNERSRLWKHVQRLLFKHFNRNEYMYVGIFEYYKDFEK